MSLFRNAINRVIVSTILAIIVFFAGYGFLALPRFIVVLNGLFAGTMAAVVLAYWRLLWNAILGINPYDRVRQMTLGFALCWAAYVLSVFLSVYLRSTGVDVNGSILTAASRYVAIIAAVLQVTAPDFGLGLFHGRDRKVLVTSASVGLIVALFVMLAQTEQVLAEQSFLTF